MNFVTKIIKFGPKKTSGSPNGHWNCASDASGILIGVLASLLQTETELTGSIKLILVNAVLKRCVESLQ